MLLNLFAGAVIYFSQRVYFEIPLDKVQGCKHNVFHGKCVGVKLGLPLQHHGLYPAARALHKPLD